MNGARRLMDGFGAYYEQEPNTGCWLWMKYTDRTGYGRVQVDGRWALAHRVMWELHNGPAPEGMGVLHSCDVTSCVNPAHLRVGTHAENMQDIVDRRRGRGVRRLDADSVREIRALRADGHSLTEIGRRFNRDAKTISWIVTDRSYRDVYTVPPKEEV